MRRIAPTVLIVLGTVFAFMGVVGIWVGRQALETDQWTQTSSKLLEQPAIRNAVANYLVDQLYANVDVAGELKSALPPRLDPLAGPAAGALRGAIGDAAKKALESPKAQEAWTQANRRAHEALVQVVKGGGPVVSTNGGVVTLDLKQLLLDLQQRAGVGGRVAGLLPANAAQITILRSNQLSAVQTIGNALKPLAAVLVILTLACYAGAIALATGPRRHILRAAGFGLIFAGCAALVMRRLVGTAVVDDLASTASIRPAAQDAWNIGTSLLVDVAGATILYGVVAVAGTVLASTWGPAVAARRWLAPSLRDARIAYGALTGLILLLLVWGPTEGTRRVLPAIVLIALMAAGLEALRRQTAKEFPPGAEAPTVEAPTVEGPAATADGPAAPAGGPAALSELERLEELHRNGSLDDEEFAAAKHRVLTHT